MRTEQIKYLLMSVALLCCTSYSVDAQNSYTTSKIIEGKNHREVGENIEVTNTNGDTFVLSKGDVTTSIVVERQINEVKIESIGAESIIQGLESDVVVINVSGLTIITKSKVDPVPVVADTQMVATTTDQTNGAVVDDSEYISDEGLTINDGSIDNSRMFEFMLSIGAGCLLYDETVFVVNGQMRGLFRVNSRFRAGLALSGDIYTFPAEVGLNYTDSPKSLYMVDIMAAFDVSLWNASKYPAILPARLTADIGYGTSMSSAGYSGVALSPGLLWHIVKNDNKSKMCLSANYKFQYLNEDSYATSVILSIGYKF
ncbi:MAG: hypothetical protein SNI70_07090 [Rikenellaceae bacterium]